MNVGDKLGPRAVESVDPEKMKLMAAILRDPNPIHFDPSAVSALGLGDRTINQGPATLSYLIDMVCDWAGGRPALRRFDSRLLSNVFAGDRVVCEGEVTVVDEAAGVATVEIRAIVDGHDVIAGTAVVSLR